jgi:hypothetical protein
MSCGVILVEVAGCPSFEASTKQTQKILFEVASKTRQTRDWLVPAHFVHFHPPFYLRDRQNGIFNV